MVGVEDVIILSSFPQSYMLVVEKPRAMNFGVGAARKGKSMAVAFVLLLTTVTSLLVGVAYGASSPYASSILDENESMGVSPVVGTIDVTSLPQATTATAQTDIPIDQLSVATSASGASTPEVFASEVSSNIVKVSGGFTGLAYDPKTNAISPPDGAIAAGPRNVIEMVNIRGEVFTKSGVPISPPGVFSMNSFFGVPSSNFVSDPKVLFDSISGRFFASEIDVTTNAINIAVSKTNDATGTFCRYNFKAATGNLPDQPILGLSSDKFVISANDFNTVTSAFDGVQLWTVVKSQLVGCTNATFNTQGPTKGAFSLYPVQSLSSTSAAFLVATIGPSTIRLVSITGLPPTVSFSTTNLAVSSFSLPPSAIQKGTTFKLDTGDNRVEDAVWQNGKLWLSYSTKCTPSGDTMARSCIHLIQIDTTLKKVLQDFNFGQSGHYFFYPAIRQTSIGNLLVIFGFSSSSDFPGLQVTEQATTDPINSLETPLLFKTGTGSVTLTFACGSGSGLPSNVCRYGDYFAASVDPGSPSTTVWVEGEIGSGMSDPKFGPAWGTEFGTVTG